MVQRILLALLVTASPLPAQSRVGGRAELAIGEIISLQVQAGGGAAVLDADGIHRELESAVRLEVFSNRSWQLWVVASAASTTAAGGPSNALNETVWWKQAGGESSASYRRAEAWPVLVASGSRGRTVVELDYRWVDAPEEQVDPGALLHFTLSAR